MLQEPAESVTAADWSYGFGAYDEATQRVTGFTPLPHFTGNAWQGGEAWPDAALGWVQLTAIRRASGQRSSPRIRATLDGSGGHDRHNPVGTQTRTTRWRRHPRVYREFTNRHAAIREGPSADSAVECGNAASDARRHDRFRRGHRRYTQQ